MSDQLVAPPSPNATDAQSASAAPGPQRLEPSSRRLRELLGFRNISAIYILIILFVVFSLWIPDTFLTSTTWRTLIDSQSIVGLAAIALVISLAAGVFNLAVGHQVGAAGIIVGALLAKADLSTPVAIGLALLAGITIGLLCGLLVVRARIDSFIATLGVSSLLAALITAVSDGQQILELPKGFADLGTSTLFGISFLTYPVVALIVVSFVVWYVLERTPSGAASTRRAATSRPHVLQASRPPSS